MLNYRFRIYPTPEQELVLEQTLDGCRWVYNYFLSISPMSEYDMNYALTELKEQHPWLRNYHSKMLQMVCKQVTICRKNRKWYAVAACKILHRQHCTIKYSKIVGIDVGITKFIHDSDNNVIDNPQFLTKMLKPLRRAHRRISRRQVGSNNYKKARYMLARLYERIQNRRKDFLHKASDYYGSRYDLIFIERLRVATMTRNHKLARKILDSSWSTFKRLLQYKANRVVEVEPAYTSINCSQCGHPVPKSLAVRTHVCPKCEAVLDRDYNSSLNIKCDRLELLGLPVERREVTPVEIAQRSLKQEACEFIRR